MNTLSEQRLRELLEAYFDGTSTEAQEAALIEFFASGRDVPAGMEAEAAMFRTMDAARRGLADVPSDLRGRIVRATVGRRRRIISGLSAAAAAAAILAGLFFLTPGQEQPAPAPELAAELPDPYEEVTDSARVVEITSKVFGRLTASLDAAGSGVGRADAALVDFRETVNKYSK